ncbi:hypothetical protein QVA66_02845 [Staphylococcus chromogenes]|nr:hypothetical protein [Staphylococcus chromogenes]
MTNQDMEQQPAPRRRRAERKSPAENIDRSWDTPEATMMFSDATDPVDPKASEDSVVIFDEDTPEVAESTELDRKFWEEQKPPHYSS